jgi:transcriptional regulator with XRE-family HTH domain
MNNIKELRKKQKITLQELADIVGTSKTNIWQIEKGINEPGITKAYKIANALKVSVFRIWPNDK